MSNRQRRGALGHWLVLLAGPLVWSAHFLVVTIAIGWDAGVGADPANTARVVVAAATATALLGLTWLLLAAYRARADDCGDARDLSRFWRGAGRVQLWFALVAVIWQALPAVLVR